MKENKKHVKKTIFNIFFLEKARDNAPIGAKYSN